MKRFAVLGCLFLLMTCSSCQCAWPPDIGPVEDEEARIEVLQEVVPSDPAVRPLFAA